MEKIPSIDDMLNKSEMEKYNSPILATDILKSLVEIGCPIKTHKALKQVIDYQGSNVIAMRVGRDGRPNGTFNTDPSKWHFEKELTYEPTSLDQVLNWLEDECNVFIEIEYDISSETWCMTFKKKVGYDEYQYVSRTITTKPTRNERLLEALNKYIEDVKRI